MVEVEQVVSNITSQFYNLDKVFITSSVSKRIIDDFVKFQFSDYRSHNIIQNVQIKCTVMAPIL